VSLLEVDNLSVQYPDSAAAAVDGLGFSIRRGEALGMVGKSGSGKTQTAMAIMGLLPGNADASGSIRFEDRELLNAPAAILNEYRACRIAMVFQDPRSALNPYIRIGKQLSRILPAHGICTAAEARERTIAMLSKVGLPDPERQYRAFPHELSGGMRQRAMIGAALLGEPDLLIADEPTTALDVTVQAQILRLIRDLHEETNSALLLITHDLGVIAGSCERVLVLDQGAIVEEGKTREVFHAPRDVRTRALLAVAPKVDSPVMVEPVPEPRETVLHIDHIAVRFRERRSDRGESLNAVQPMSLCVAGGETIAVVGESGSGKTSLVRAALGLIRPDSGTVSFVGKKLPADLTGRDNATCRQLQMVFQDPLASLNPAMMIGQIVAEPMIVHAPGANRLERLGRAEEMLEKVGLDESLRDRFPHELSGGQAQRVAIARALILQPKVLICDEAVAALDGSVQAEILKLLTEEQARTGLSMIFITHDLAVVRQVSHRVLVMYMGRLCEVAGNNVVFDRPRHPYTKALLSSVPVLDPDNQPDEVPLSGESASMLRPPPGCPFHPRCQHAVAICSETAPKTEMLDGTAVACHRASELDLRN